MQNPFGSLQRMIKPPFSVHITMLYTCSIVSRDTFVELKPNNKLFPLLDKLYYILCNRTSHTRIVASAMIALPEGAVCERIGVLTAVRAEEERSSFRM